MVDAISPDAMTAALAECLGMAVGDVEVIDADGDPGLPNWRAPVLCTYEPVFGDVAWSLDIYLQDHVTVRPLESEVAAGLARAAATTVLFPAVEALPSAYWAAMPDGLVTRARLEPSDDDSPLFEVTAVEAPVPQFPRATVTRFADVVREQRPACPMTEAFDASVEQLRRAALHEGPPSFDDSAIAAVHDHLMVWERVIVQMESGWAPSGWYPADLYRERLQARDTLVGIGARLPREVTELLDTVLEDLDRRFAESTVEDVAGGLIRELTGKSPEEHTSAGRWWHRRPDPLPWEQP